MDRSMTKREWRGRYRALRKASKALRAELGGGNQRRYDSLRRKRDRIAAALPAMGPKPPRERRIAELAGRRQLYWHTRKDAPWWASGAQMAHGRLRSERLRDGGLDT